MLLKSSLLLLVAPALVAVAASPVPAAAPNAATKDAFPNYDSPQAQQVLLDMENLIKQDDALTKPANASSAVSKPTSTRAGGSKTSAAKSAPTKTVQPTKPTSTPTKNSTQKRSSREDDLVKIHRFAQYARAAYQLTGVDWDCPKCKTSPDMKYTKVDMWWDRIIGPSYGFVAHDDNSKEIIIGFRGSTTIMDWFKNAKFAQTSWPAQVPGSKVHIGFKDVYTSVATRVKSAVSDLIKKYPTYSIVLVGHSLGGAEATIAAADFVATNPAWAEKMWLFTYGQPRTGNDKFATWLNGRGFPIYRATYNADVVPMIPPRKLGYQHIAEEVHFPGSGSLMFCGKNPENPDCQLKVPTLKMSIKDHGRYPGMSK